MTPIDIFKQWFDEELKLTKANIPTVCCLSTIGVDGYPNARYVSLKEVLKNNFIITGTLTSRKGVEINLINKVALTFWWTETEKQVRIQGNVTSLTNDLADKYFAKRDRDSQIVSIVSNQGQHLDNIENLHKKYQEIDNQYLNQNLKRPENWGGYSVEPIRIEFLEFKQTRFHNRILYEQKGGIWTHTYLQP
jgi:pyridoxamine 5'-phosphate oxidase